MESKNEKKIINALKDIAESIKILPKAILSCKAVYSDLKHLEKAIASMVSPWTFAVHVGKDIVINGVSIFKHVVAMVEEFKA